MKYVFVSGRSSHTVTANSESEARQKIKREYPYADIRFISPINKAQKRVERSK